MKTLSLKSLMMCGVITAGGLSTALALTNQEQQAALTPQAAFDQLLSGNERFVAGVTANRDRGHEVAESSKGQYPLGVVLTCLDSRTAPETMFDQGVGDVFVGRIAGNYASDDMIGSFEFAHKLAGAKVLVVVGHTECGAVKGACDGAKMGNLTTTLAQLDPALKAVPAEVTPRNAKNADFVQKVADANVRLTVARVLEQSPVLKEMVDAGQLGVIGGMYDLSTGKVNFFADTAHGLKLN
jgi:carbonic anhydrase